MARIFKNMVDDLFPNFRQAKATKTMDAHAAGEAAKPVDDTVSADDVAAKLKTPTQEPSVTDSPAAAGPVDDVPRVPEETPPAKPKPAPHVEGPTAAELTDPDLAAPDRRTRARNVNTDFLDINNVEDIGKVLDVNATRMNYGTEAPKSLEQTRSNVMGKEMELFQETLREAPEALSDEQLLAGRDVMLTLVNRQQELAGKIAKNQATPEEVLEFDLVTDQAATVQNYMQGKIRVAARALNSMKVTAQTINSYNPQRISEATAGTNAQQRASAVLEMHAQGANPDEIIKQSAKASALKQFGASVVNLRSGSLLTGIKTQVVNAGNNAFHAGLRTLVIKPMAAGVGTLRTRGEAGADRVYLGEVSAELVGMIHGLAESLQLAKTTWYDGTFKNKGEYISPFGGRKIDEIAEDNQHIGSATAGLLGDTGASVLRKTGIPQGLDMYHRGVEAVSFGPLTAADDFFKSSRYRSALYAEAFRDVQRKGLEGAAAEAHIADILETPPKEMHLAALREAEVSTFTNKEDVGDLLNTFADAIVKAGNMVPLVRWFFPFMRTPTAILDRNIKMSILAPAQAKVREQIKAGGPEADMAIAHIMAGTSIHAIIGSLISLGLVTGQGPSRLDDPTGAVRQGLKATGWQQNSVRIGDKYVSLQRGFDPVMLPILSVATAVEAAQYSKDEADAWDITAGSILNLLSQFSDASFMEGMQQLLNLISGRVSYTDWVARESTTMIPAMARDIDAVFRYATGEEGYDYVPKTDDMNIALMLHWRKAVPFMKPPMVARYWDGSVATAGGGDMMFAWNTFSPIRSSWLYNSEGRAADPATAALVDARVPLAAPNSKIDIGGGRYDLLAAPNGHKLYDLYRQEVGKFRRRAVEPLVNSAAFKKDQKNNLTGPNSPWSGELRKALTAGRQAGYESFMRKVNSSGFNWSEHGDEVKSILTGAATRMLNTKRAMGAETPEDVEDMRDLEMPGVQTRGRLSPPEGSGSDKIKRSNPITGDVEEVLMR